MKKGAMNGLAAMRGTAMTCIYRLGHNGTTINLALEATLVKHI